MIDVVSFSTKIKAEFKLNLFVFVDRINLRRSCVLPNTICDD